MSRPAAVILGLSIAVFGQLLAYILAWGGEGWDTPFEVSLAMFILYPVALARLGNTGSSSIAIELLLLGIAAILDLYVVMEAAGAERSWFVDAIETGAAFVLLWGLVWLVWQFLVVGMLIHRLAVTGDS